MKDFIIAFSVLTFSTLAPAQTKARQARPWQHEKSDIPVDARIHFGHLPDGLRFAWMRNSEPNKRCYLRLHVDVGSLAEEDDERGLAHFLEHMAFNGSRHFPAGTLVEWFQKHGMGFGADTNAATGFSQTIYQIDLPTSDRAAIDEGLLVLRDFADGLLLEQKEIDAEKGVVDAEERERDSPTQRVLEQTCAMQFAGTRIPTRTPIGKKPVRDAFTSASLRKFYAKWYRPEKITLVLVGDIGELDPAPLIEAHFADLRAPEDPPPPEPGPGAPQPASPAFCIYEKDLSAEQISLAMMAPWQERPETLARWQEDLPVRCARRMLNLRFSELRKRADAPFLGAGASDAWDTELRVQAGEELGIGCAAEHWQEALSFCEQELRRALEFGFAAAELAEIRADILRALDEAVEREKTRSSASYASLILDAAENPDVANDPATERRLLKPLVEALDLESCHRVFAEAWRRGRLVLSMSGNLDLGPEGPKLLREAYEASTREPVEARKSAVGDAFAYAADPERRGKIAAQKHVDEFDLEQVVFENGVQLRVKKTDFKQKEILIAALLGEGRLTLDPKEGALPWVAGQILTSCGLGVHSADDLRRLMAGKEVAVRFAIDDDQFQFSGATTREDLLRQCELMRAYLVDPGWREEGLSQFQKMIPLFYDSLLKQPGGPIATQFLPEFYSHEPRIEFATRETTAAVTTAAVRDWLAPQFEHAPLDIVIVGDLDLDAAVQAVARTFGLLEKRRDPQRFEERRQAAVLRTGLALTYGIQSTVPKAFIMVAFPAGDGRNALVRRSQSFLAQILQDRLRVEVREKLGAAYSPGAGAPMSEVYPDDGWFAIQTEAEVDKSDAMVEACLAVADRLAEHGITDEEVLRAGAPLQAMIRDQLRNNGYWLHWLSMLHAREHVYDDMRTFPDFLQDMKPALLDPIAKKYLKRERASVAIVLPKKAEDGKKNAAAPGKKD